jgi:NitT/TauT family transport system ATP-binding protein
MSLPLLQVNNLSLVYNSENGDLEAIDDITFSLAEQEFVCLLGPSGSGKTTLLRVLAGLLRPSAGEVIISPETEHKPRVGLVFQQANLMPWRNVLQNITLPLELQGVDEAERMERAHEWVELIGLQGFENSLPRDLSGGMAQRVALARAFIQDPDLLLLDEPFGALDALTRERMGDELLKLWQARRKTVLMVTHSISESLLLSDRVLVFTSRPGRVCLDLDVPFERPRDEAIRYTSQFGQLAHQLREAIGLDNPENRLALHSV